MNGNTIARTVEKTQYMLQSKPVIISITSVYATKVTLKNVGQIHFCLKTEV